MYVYVFFKINFSYDTPIVNDLTRTGLDTDIDTDTPIILIPCIFTDTIVFCACVRLFFPPYITFFFSSGITLNRLDEQDTIALVVQAVGGASASTAVKSGRNPAKVTF